MSVAVDSRLKSRLFHKEQATYRISAWPLPENFQGGLARDVVKELMMTAMLERDKRQLQGRSTRPPVDGECRRWISH
jgi:hypothetical protein